MKRVEAAGRIAVLTLGFQSAVLVLHATEPTVVDANNSTLDQTFGADDGVSSGCPFHNMKNLILAVESQAEASEAEKLAEQLANPDFVTHQRAFLGE